MANHVYVAPVFGEPFYSLEDAKWNVKIAFTRSEVKKYFKKNEVISHYVNSVLRSVTPIHVDEDGNISFGKTRRV